MKPVYVVIGTRAQLIKMGPIMRFLDERHIDWSFIYTAQHRETIRELIVSFGLKEPDKTIIRFNGEADNRFLFARWLLKIFYVCLLKAKKIIPIPGVLLTHGDTVTTPIAALLGRLSGCTVIHVEAGLRSFNIWRPFPEEICRLITFRLAHHYLCPDKKAVQNLSNYKGRKISLEGNTLYDAFQSAVALQLTNTKNLPATPYAVVSIHRYENIFNRSMLEKIIISSVEMASKKLPIIFVLHPATRKALIQYGLMNRLQKIDNIILSSRYDYFSFANLLVNAEFVISDGGSNQEELTYLGLPCLLLRDVTERQEGLGANIVLSGYDWAIIEHFLDNYENFRREKKIIPYSPSQLAVNFIESCAKV